MKKSLIAALLIAVGSFAAAQELTNISFKPIKPFNTNVAAFAAKSAGQTAPMDVQVQNKAFDIGQIMVPCSFDGQSHQCLFDTGSNICIIESDNIFSKYPTAGKSCEEGASGKQVCSDIIKVGDLKVGGMNFGAQPAQRRTPAQACDASSQGDEGDLVGGIWHSFLGHKMALNFGSKTVSVDPPVSAPGGQLPMNLVRGNTYMVIPATFGKTAGQMLVDTGAGLNVFDQSFVDANPGSFAWIGKTSTEDSSCQKIPVNIYMISAMDIGGNSAAGAMAVAMDLTSIKGDLGKNLVGIVGFNVISQYNWWVDLMNHRFSITPLPAKATIASFSPASLPQVLKFRLPSLLQ